MPLAAPTPPRHSASIAAPAASLQETTMMTLSPVIAVHMTLALGALALGPVALTARKGSRLHRTSGYAWAVLMIGAAISSAFIRDFRLPNLMGYTPIHIVTVGTLVGVTAAIVFAARRNIALHKRIMWRTYLGGCVGAGLFALLPSRLLGDLVWHQLLALV
jgi:uncharacterized membrane protein